jgi:hypothetical protein
VRVFRRLRVWVLERVEDYLDRRSVRRPKFETLPWEDFKRMLDDENEKTDRAEF